MLITPVSGYKASLYKHDNIKRKEVIQKNFNYLSSDTVSFAGKIPSSKQVINVFDKYNPVIESFRTYNLKIHNKEIAKKLQENYSSETFSKLFEFAKKKGVFDLNINDSTHYITTSLIDPKENPLMGKLIWVTDSCRFMPVLKDMYPEAAVPLMENMSTFYKKQERNFNKIINNPLEYELNHDWPNTAKNGIGHVFNPNNMTTHKWFAHTRLESPGLYLQAMGELITDGLNGAKYGYKSAEQISQNSIDAIANVTAYLKQIAYPYGKSTGAWEEQTFMITPSSDVAIINEGFRKIINLMYSPTKNPEILKVRQRLLASPNGKVFADEKGLREMLNVGEYRIRLNSLEEVPLHNKKILEMKAKSNEVLPEYEERILDGALSFIPHTEKFSADVVDDASEIIKRMDLLQTGDYRTPEIVRENGVIRYVGDRYLNMTSGHQVNEANNIGKKTEAQWFMTSDISKSYGIAAKRILDRIEKYGIDDSYTVDLLNKAIRKETEFINRAFARITGKNSYKANGKPCPPYQIPEAYQAVTNSKGEVLFVPGTHTPLGWAQASLYDASKLFSENLARLEKLNL